MLKSGILEHFIYRTGFSSSSGGQRRSATPPIPELRRKGPPLPTRMIRRFSEQHGRRARPGGHQRQITRSEGSFETSAMPPPSSALTSLRELSQHASAAF